MHSRTNPSLLYIKIEYIVCACMVFGYVICIASGPCDKTRRIFTESWGVITDGSGESNYTQDSHCEWLIKANGTGKFITLTFKTMGTECSYDYVFVYDGDSFRSPLLGSFSGKTAPQRVIASSGYMLILLYSDTNYVLDGFRAEFSVTDCPNNCSHNESTCHNHTCVCKEDWGGEDCSHRLCPDNCGYEKNHGQCITGRCICADGYSGSACSLHNADAVGNKWHWLSHTGGGLLPRAAHTAIYIEQLDSLYVYGGYDLNYVLGALEIYNFRNSTWLNAAGHPLTDKTLMKNIDPQTVASVVEDAGPETQRKWRLPGKDSYFTSVLLSFRNMSHSTLEKRYPRSINEPESRYGHAACEIPNGFLIYGGKLDNGSLSNELWSYNVYEKTWLLRGTHSEINPPALTRHTLTNVNEDIYLFGGSTTDGEFSSKLYKILLREDGEEVWEYVQPRGGKELDVRVVAHTTVYHKASNSLLVYGGVVAGVARFSKLSDRMFAFHLNHKHWTELRYPREHLRENFVPRERAFHTANVIGNYLIVFGGYSHRHNKEEICYDNNMYLYHLGCHAWVNQETLGDETQARYPKMQGVFAHAASVRNGNTLLLVGGYHGNVNGDLLAYTVPPMVAAKKGDHYEPEAACSRHKKYLECSADPECGWCSVDEQCYGRTVGANCTTNLQTTRCPGVCPALGDCHSCLIHGKPTGSLLMSVANKLGLGDCTWCVQNARCHHKDDSYGVCGLREDTPSQVPGWWGAKGTEVHRPEQCRQLDKRPGLTFLKYHHPVNWSQPDHVAIINATTVDFSPPATSYRSKINQVGEMVTRLLGFLRPPPHWQGLQEKLQVCVTYCNATLKLSDESGEVQLSTSLSTDKQQCDSQSWLVPQPSRVLVDFEANKSSNTYTHQQSKMELQHYRETESAKVFTFEYLEPFANGTCTQYTNCLHCLTDNMCGWCEITSTCISRDTDEQEMCNANGDWQYLTLLPSACSNCTNYISCERCVGSALCEWWVEEAKCVRYGSGSPDAVLSSDKCPIPCYERNDCTSCLDVRGRCVWCEATQQCFSFSVYTSEYQFGLCREWLDQISSTQEMSVLPARRADQCKSCQSHNNCSICLSSLSCGWCYNSENPIKGSCVQGDFNRPQITCENILGMNLTRWAYAHCPDVDECGLGLHDCHPEAICTNTDGSFSCKCRQGYAGDGKTYCNRTCDHPCVNGRCLGFPNYTCECNLGWTGENCSIDCGCNFHSNCSTEVGICDSCQDWTTGEFCENCLEGSYGNATSVQGCQKCDCNGHGNVTLGICDMETGTCYCQDNTVGRKCEKCRPNYYGNPLNGGQCYYQCEARGMLTDTIGQGISSRQSYVSPWGGPPTRECLWIISPEESNSIIQLQINSTHLNVTCGENAVYVYDGMPELADTSQQSALMSVFCREDARPSMTVETKSGHLTVHYKQGVPGEGFDAVYKVFTCGNCRPPRFCKNEQCVCMDGFIGPDCTERICPGNCSAHLKQGECDHNYGRCLCTTGWAGKNCNERLNGSQVVFMELFNTQRLSTHVEHLRKTLPRFGHSLVADHRRGLWMFGGYSLSHGPLNDIRLFDILNSTWMQVTVDSTPDAKMPQGRYYHAADIVHSRQAIYVFGGLTKHTRSQLNENILKDLWQFDLHNQRWNEMVQQDKNWPPPLAGHTLTCYKNVSYDSLILIGGFSPLHGFLSVPWEFRLDKNIWTQLKTRGRGPVGLYGHSTVFHAPTNSLYIFGGYHYHYNNRTVLSNRLYALRYETMHWIDLHALGEYVSPPSSFPRPRFLHSAVSTDSYMLIFGGRMSRWNYTNSFFSYPYNCSQWINFISEGTDRVGPLPTQAYAQAMTYENGSVYIVGGWGGESQYKVTRVSLPESLCDLWSANRYKCLQIRGCGYCSIEQSNGMNLTHCYSNKRHNSKICEVYDKKREQNKFGLSCEGLMRVQCNEMKNCASCLQSTGCQWCPGCGGHCLPADQPCYKSEVCTDEQVAFNSSLQCPDTQCLASDCYQCNQHDGCSWTKTDESDHNQRQPYWHCTKSNELRVESSESTELTTHCQIPCVNYTNCADCLETPNCHWSTQLNECISVNFQPMYCLGGVCGLVLQAEDKEYCPEPCESFTQCSTCLRHAHCGWCAIPDERGIGVCAEGSTDKPMTSCSTLVNKYLDIVDNVANFTDSNYSWNYVRCPPENECLNDHHTCNRDSEICEDLRDGFQCKCGPGYQPKDDGCIPVCSQGCVRGVCVQPDQCKCDFGYVGANCSIECQCNGHSNCAGPDRLKECLECHNNTMGSQCEKCKPLFVGNPKNREPCTPCLEYCNGHSDVCVDENSMDPEPYQNMTLPELESYLKVGPSGKARCIRCANKTEGSKCEKCVTGHFRGSTTLSFGCKPCNCHGHGDTCDPVTGDKCNCRNNTESNNTCGPKNNNQDCSEVQCIRCKENYHGTPTDGHQCYRQMSVDNKMCFDAIPIDECKMKPKPLVPGETVFFVVHPRFMNVDIRITVDVTQGSLNLFLSNHDDTFKVTPNLTSGLHNIELDSRYTVITPTEEDRAYDNGNIYSWLEHTAQGLRTYVTIQRNSTLLAVRGLRDRLVITLPQDKHRLDNTKYYLLLQALPSNDLLLPSTPSYGMVFFRQDQLHIDLFVFFSVFFSCFFLFLAACVVAWKAKQAADVRRARRRHVVEMLHMAQRPFATVTLFLGSSTPLPGRRMKPRRSAIAELRPVAVEPTDDGVAAVATVFVSLPGGQSANVRLAFASSLILLVRQYPSGGRAFLRRRSHHAVQQPT